MGNDAFYFSHDVDARNDIKIKALRKEYGIAGYGAYWVVIELLRDADDDDYQMPLKEFTYIGLEEEIGAGMDVRAFIDDCINKFELFTSDGQYFWSDSLCRRMDKKEEIRNKRRQAAESRWNKSKSNANSSSRNNDLSINNASEIQMDANAMQNDTKKRKEKEKKIEDKENTTTDNSNSLLTVISDNDIQENKFTDDEFKEVAKLYTEAIEFPNQFTAQWIEDTLNEFGHTWLVNAIKIANQAGKRNQRYIKGILTNWKNNGGMKLDRDGPKKQNNCIYDHDDLEKRLEEKMWEDNHASSG